LIRRPLTALLITLICVVPAIRSTHVLYNGYSGGDLVHAQGDLDETQSRLVEWLSGSLKGAPLVVEACDEPTVKSIALRAGLPTYKGEVGGEGMCNLKDPQATFQAMMAQGVSLLIVPGKDGEIEPSGERRELLSKLTSRPDLFAVLYSKKGSTVLAPAFSDYFPRAYNPKNSS
jgi:hypothetical protein